MNNIYKEFGKRLAELRKAQKLTQTEVAAKLNTVQSTYSGYELGTRKVTMDTIVALANFFDVSLDYLILGTSSLPVRLKEKPWSKEKQELLFIYDEKLNSKGQEQLLKQARYYKEDPDYKKYSTLSVEEISALDA